MKIKRLWIGGISAFLLLEAALVWYADRPIAEYMKALDQSAHGLIDFFRSVTDLGKGAVWLWPCGLVALVCGFVSRGRNVPPKWHHLCGYMGVRALFVFGTVGVSGIAADVLKPLFGRGRPKLWLTDGVYGFEPLTFFQSVWNGMPSGHSATAFSLAFALVKLYPKGSAFWLFFAVLIAASRVAVDAHFLSDVIAGSALGWVSAEAFFRHGIAPFAKIIFPIDNRSFMR
ncbi:MAG: phosphatase PAP2 family protein [Alphaproteobacteria bacterium]|nr:phosphatase PAP2 family protein [Alphaproteobacteria bacterium]